MNETYELNDRTYIEPTVSRDEQLNFVNNLRATQQADLSKINRDTHALGTNVPMNLGGLGGAEGVFNRRYVAPQTNALVSELKAKAQASALNTALTNLQNQYQNEYQQAYRRASKRSRSSGGTTTPSTTIDPTGYDPEVVGTTKVINDGWDLTANDAWLYPIYDLANRASTAAQNIKQQMKNSFYSKIK